MVKFAKHACAAILLSLLAFAGFSSQALAQLPMPGSLVVRITAPESGSTVGGSVTVSASVSVIGVVTVGGVQFKLDDIDLGAEDTSAPYAIPWNTGSAANGLHVLTAVARDGLGIRYTSDPVTVTVSNAPPPDTTPPTVSITSPASGASVSGTVAVSATASDNASVAGVQFLIDGANSGSEDTAAPYSLSWDTRTVADGSHVLAAVARDAAGNRTTSAPVAVTVSNSPPPPQPPPPSTTRYEESDVAIGFSAGWSQDASRTWSAGTAAFSTTPGDQATFNFNGPSASWIGGRSPRTGIARVFVDGIFLGEVDTYSKTEEVRVPMFTASGLSGAAHTLTIEVTGSMNASATGTLIVVDAFDVPAPAVSRLQETDPDIAYSAGWVQGDPSRAWSAGAAALSATPGARATLNFIGTSVSWIGARGPQTGIARVSIDGTVVADVDTYAASEQIQAAVFTATGLADTNHALTIETTGLKNASSAGTLVVLDGIEVAATGTRVQETHPAIAYSAGWIIDNRDKAYSEGVSAETNTPGAQATFTFSGTGVRWIGARGPQTGIARVFLDATFVQDIDTYALTEGPQHTDFAVSGLPFGTHTLTIQLIGRNPASSDFWVLVDAFDVIP